MPNDPKTSKPAAGDAKNASRLKEIAGFEIIGKLGQGGMGAVFKARQKSLDRVVALKVLPPQIAKDASFIERFQREARASAKLNHPNIVQGIDVGKDSATGLWYFAMEYVDGPSLKKVLEEQKIIPETRALEITREVAKALETIGSHQMVHRDIKPDNILLTQRGETKLADLGLAKQLNEDAGLTQSGQAVGTPHYMAPEQVRGKFEECDIRTDIYSLGATLFHLVTGHAPYTGDTSAVVMAKHLTEALPKANKSNPAVSEGCTRLIEKMMQKKIEQRLQTPADLIVQIDKVLKGESHAKPHGIHKPAGPRPALSERKRESAPEKRSPVLLYVVIGGVAALVVAGILLKRGNPNVPPVAENIKKPAASQQVAETKGPEPKSDKLPANPDELYKAAVEFEQKNNESYDDAAPRYRLAAQAAKGTPRETEIQDKVDDALAALHARQHGAAEKAWKAIDEKAAELAASGNYDDAIAACQALPAKFLPVLKDKSEDRVRAFHQEAEGKIAAIAKTAEAFAADAEPAEGLKSLAEAEKFKYAPMRGIVATLKERLTGDLANEGTLKQKKADLLAIKRLGDVLQKFDTALLESRDLKAAAEIAAAAKKDEALTAVEPVVRAMGEVIAAYDEAARFDQDSLTKLIGQNVELETGSTVHSGKIARVQDGVISLEISMQGAVGLKKIKIADLSDAQYKKLLPAFSPKTDAQHVAQGYTRIAKGNQDYVGAVEHLALAPDFPLTAHCRALADKVRANKEKALAESGAPAAWADLQSHAGAGKATEDPKGIAERLGKFENEFGATQYAATIKDKLDALKARLARASSPNLIVNGDFEKNTFDGWEKSGGSQNAEFSAQAHGGRSALQITLQRDYNVGLIQTVAVEPQSEYRLSCWIKHLKGSLTDARGGVFLMDGAADRRRGEGHMLEILTKAKMGEWVQVETQFVAQNPSVRVELLLKQRSTAEDRFSVLVDDLELSRISNEKQTVALPPAPVPELFKLQGLVFWVSPTFDPAGTSREMLSNSAAAAQGTVQITTDSGLKSLQFDNSYANYRASDAVKNVSNGGSVFVWIKVERLPAAWAGLVSRNDLLPGASGHSDISLMMIHDKFELFFNYPENTFPGIDGKTMFGTKRPLHAGKWMMLGATWDSKTITIWVNGEKDNSYASPNVPIVRTFPETLTLGCDPAGSPEYFNGLMNNAMIYNRALSEFEIKALYLRSGIIGK